MEPASSADAQAAGNGPCRLVLLGFRNDLARHRVLAYLAQQVGLPVAADIALPHTLHERIEAPAAAHVLEALERLGAVARLLPLEIPPPPIPAADADDAANDALDALPERRTGPVPHGAPWLLIVLVVGLGLIRATLPPQVVDLSGAPPVHTQQPVANRVTPRLTSAQSEQQIKQLLAHADLDGAEQAIDAALEAGEDAAIVSMQGALRSKRGDAAGARQSYERAVALGLEEPTVFLALAGTYREQGRQREAVDMLQRAQQSGASGTEFEQMKRLVIAEQDAESGYGSLTSPHFAVSFDAGENNAAAQWVLSELEDAYLVVGHKLGQYPDHRTPVVLYPERDFQRVTHSPGWAGALYDGRIKIPVLGLQGDDPELGQMVRHEYAHSLILAISGGHCPVWLNEGTAMWAEELRGGEGEEWARAVLQLRAPFRIADLERSFGGYSTAQAAAAYAQSYLAVRHLVARYGDRSLQDLLAAFATADSTATAFHLALPVELSAFEDELQRAGAGG